MKLLSWNCRRLRKVAAVQALQGLITLEGVFLCETKASKMRLERIRIKLDFDEMEVVEADGWK